MSQAPLVFTGTSGQDLINFVEAALQANVSFNAGATEPTTKYAYQFWADTSVGLLKQRNAANSAWIILGSLGSTGLDIGHDGGQCQLVYTSATIATLSPYNGNSIDLWNGTIWTPYTIPDVGITIDTTGSVWDAGAGLTTIAASTEYDIYCDYNSGTPRLVGYKHSVTSHTLSDGRQILTGTKAYRLVGKIQANASSQLEFSLVNRSVISWFNRRKLPLFVTTLGDNTSGTIPTEMNSAHRLSFLSWGTSDDLVSISHTGTLSNSVAGASAYVMVGIDASLQAALSGGFSTGIASQIPASSLWNGTVSEGFHYATTKGKVSSGTMTLNAGELKGEIQG